MKEAKEKKGQVKLLLISIILIGFVSPGFLNPQSAARDKTEQPERVMDVTGVAPGMVIGEVGAGYGYFTFWLARRVEESGKVYANDINRNALSSIERKCREEGITNIETILGEVDDPLFPDNRLDMVFLVNSFHDLEKPVELLQNLKASLRPGATVVIMDRDPEKFNDRSHHFLSREEVLERIAASEFELDRIETFLAQHTIYIIRPGNSGLSARPAFARGLFIGHI